MVAGREPPDDGMEQRLRRKLFGGGGDPPVPRRPPVIAGRYELLESIGKGSMGEVHRGRDITNDATVAVKLLRGCAKAAVAGERFRREAELICRLKHPNIVSVSEAGDLSDGGKYIVMELVHGTSLRTQLLKDSEVSPDCAHEVLWQVADAVAIAHAAGIVHRDLSPANILLTQRDTGVHCTVIDFGLAKCIAEEGPALTETGDRLGTPHYMSPEQCAGAQAGPASDIYALGCIAYQMFTGVTVFKGPTLAELLDQHRFAAPQPFALAASHCAASPAIEAVVMRALRKDPGERWPTMTSFRDALARARAEAPVRSRSRATVAIAAVLVAVAALAAAAQF